MAYIDVSGLTGISLLAGIDPVTREMFLSLATVDASINPIEIYKEMRICRRLDENLRGFELYLAAFGKVPKGGGKFTERYVQERLGTRIIPYDASHGLTITGVIITDDGQEGTACFDRSSLSPGVEVDIDYVPLQVEVIEVATGGGGFIEADRTKLTEAWKRLGLDATAPVTNNSDGSYSVGGIVVTAQQIVDAIVQTRQ